MAGPIDLKALELDGSEIAVVGMAGRFPGARDVGEYWRNLRQGVESIRDLTDDELERVPEDLRQAPSFVPRVAIFDHYDRFDAPFFDLGHREAEITDPQHRVLLECAWSALENAGVAPAHTERPTGVFVGATLNTYLVLNLARNRAVMEGLEPVQLNIGNGPDFLATRVAYKLNLKGPAYTVQSACSTSLLAVHVACQSLYSEECDLALAGGVSINLAQLHGYRHVEGGMASPDGRCRPFDAKAEGTLFGGGVGLVVLKRLSEALDDGDTVRAVIRGSAINNDGSLKVGYTAPSIEGQAQAITEALAESLVEPETVGYVETHGTATPLGDPIEIEALGRALRGDGAREEPCRIGSVKGNIGHLDAAAGIAGLIKTVLALEHREIPPSLHYERPNPSLKLEASPFEVVAEVTPWRAAATPRRAGVSAFGVGGTNVHVVLQEAPMVVDQPGRTAPAPHLLRLSARTPVALDEATAALAGHLAEHPDLDLADVAHTLEVGRSPLEHRRFVVACDLGEAVDRLGDGTARTAKVRKADRPVVFLLPGQGALAAGATRGLYEAEEPFARQIDRAAAVLDQHAGIDLLAALYPARADGDGAADLAATHLAQPALFALEHALASAWMARGVTPRAVCGHSVGELTAACLAGVFELEDGLRLVAERGRLMGEQPAGAMLSVPLTEGELQPHLRRAGDSLVVAVINAPSRLVVAGTKDEVERLRQRLADAGVTSRPLATSHAFHSPMMDGAVEPLRRLIEQIELREPRLPLLSSATGAWLDPAAATRPDHWVDQMRRPVLFSQSLEELFTRDDWLLLEVGPGETLSQLARRHPSRPRETPVVPSLARGDDEPRLWLEAFGRLWSHGVEIEPCSRPGERRRLPLPTYPFERRRYWIEPAIEAEERSQIPTAGDVAAGRAAASGWFYLPGWRRCPRPAARQGGAAPRRWLLLGAETTVGRHLADYWTDRGIEVVPVSVGDGAQGGIGPADGEALEALLDELDAEGRTPDGVVHLWSLLGAEPADDLERGLGEGLGRGLDSVLALGRVLAGRDRGPSELVIVTAGALGVTGAEPVVPARAMLEAPCLVLPQEIPGLACRLIDVGRSDEVPLPVSELAAELGCSAREPAVACRGRERWVRRFEPVSLEPPAEPILATSGAVVVTGGLTDMGLALARDLASASGTRLVVLEPPGVPRPCVRGAELEAAGAPVTWVDADLTDRDAVAAALARVADEGPITGVLHAARVAEANSFHAASETGSTQLRAQLAARVAPLLALEGALAPDAERTWFVCSSLASVVGGVGTLAYTAASLALDALVDTRRSAAGPARWGSACWDAWHFADRRRPQITDASDELAAIALRPGEGVAAFRAILAADLGRLVVSKADLDHRLRRRDHQQGASPDSAPAERHPRPELDVPYVPPSGELEETIAEVWSRVLGLDRVGVFDNFFELGGDSLVAVQTADRLKRALGREVPAVAMYEGLTVRSLAETLSAEVAVAEGGGEMAQEEGRRERAERRQSFRERRRQRRREDGDP